ncbi:MAG TPA: fluoride efflux transporter CrcB [Vicinamibacterales bacterium]|nr:fluoride efflux transporter CrcB [Vicinamibacterales bacterium]
MTWLAVALGGALGSLARHWMNLEISHRLERPVPWATFVVNVVGCLVIGALAGRVAAGRLHLSPAMRTFVFVGVLGGFTTFSSFGLDTFTLGHGGEHAAAFWNVAGQVGLGLGAVWLGFNLGL